MNARRFLRFRLRTALIVCTLFCVLLALIILPAYRERRAAEALIARGAMVYYAKQLDQDGTPRKAPNTTRWDQAWLHCDLTDHVGSVVLYNCANEKKDIAHLRYLPQLERLDFCEPSVTDDWLPQLARLPKLRRLHLHYASITDDGLAQLQPLEKLEDLSLYHSKVGDGCLDALTNFKQLRKLNLGYTKLEGKHLTKLGSLTNLEALDLVTPGINASDAQEIAELQRALPKCQISWEDF